MSTIDNYTITGGKFSEKGNFTGYTLLGEKFFIHKNQMAGLSWTKNEDVKFPFFIVGAERQIGQLDKDGNEKLNEDGSPVLVDRRQALSVFATKADITKAYVESTGLTVGIKLAVSASATASGLDEKSVALLLAEV